jgi:hypothetical protein
VDVGTCPHQVLAATLSLFEPQGAEYAIDTIQDLDMKLCMHLVGIFFSLNNVTAILMKIYEQPPRTFQNSDFQSHFSVLKVGLIFP